MRAQRNRRNLRVIESTLNPTYQAKNDVIELNADYTLTPALTFTSDTGYNHDFLWSTEDYNRFNTQPGIFVHTAIGNGVPFSDLDFTAHRQLSVCETAPSAMAANQLRAARIRNGARTSFAIRNLVAATARG